MNDAIKEELGKYWDNLPQDLSRKQEEFLLKASCAIDFHKKLGTEPEPYLSSVETLLEMHKNILAAGETIEKAVMEANPPMNIGDGDTMEAMMTTDTDYMAAIGKVQRMMELPFYTNAQMFEINNDLPEYPNNGDIAEYKHSISVEQLNNLFPAAFEITNIRKINPATDFEEAHDCFSAMQDRALNHFGKMTGLKLETDYEASNEENKNRLDLREMILRHPREVLVLTDGCEDTKIFGLSDLKAKIEKVSDRAKSVDPLNLDKSIDALQSNRQTGFSRQLGIGKELTMQEISALEKKSMSI